MNEMHFPDSHDDMAVLRLDAMVRARWANIVVKAALFVSFAIALTVSLTIAAAIGGVLSASSSAHARASD